ncbi:MAG TPA: serine/threonine-protein kinase, partial [Labilithrix sp.]|nr:serine/threonine-protein kinase [Labilithrix sp.]
LHPEIAAWTAARIADALHYAHELTDEHGKPLALVHRDVNPANVFATFDGEVKLFDFGLAKVTATDASGKQMLAGKLSYLSPEQIMQLPLDRRSDVFSLGTTLWELLTSKRLFRRDSDIETVRAVQLGPIPDPRTVAPEVPDELAHIAKTALERNRDHRYKSTAELARELDEFVLSRTTHEDVRARLAQLVDTLFPGEQKRQAGWLKPAISSSNSRSMKAVGSPSGSVSIPPSIPPDPRREGGEKASVPPSSIAKPSVKPIPASSQRPPPVPRTGSGSSVTPPRPTSNRPDVPAPTSDPPRPKRVPVPLPSQSRIEAVKAEIPEPSDSAPTELYVPLPPDRKRS